jgi:hypothetical protein
MRLALAFLLLSACGNDKSQFGDDAGTFDASDASSKADGPNPFADGGPTDSGTADGKPSIVNLIFNGNFEQGNTLFGSDYAYATNNTAEGQYTVGTNGQAFNGSLVSAGDHTTGASQMFIGNGKSTPDRVWFTTSIAVQPSTSYYFEAFVMNLCCTVASGIGDGVNPEGPSVLSFYANGQLLGTRSSTKLGVWKACRRRGIPARRPRSICSL